MNPESISVVAFDCDGVMFDSTSANRAYYNHLLARFDLPVLTPDQFAYTHMHTVDDALAFLFKDHAMLAQVQQYRRQMSYLSFVDLMVPEPQLKPLLDKLRPNYKRAIATNRTDTMDRVLEVHHLENQFNLVVTALDVERPKPHPDQLQMILDHFNIDPGQMLYIGDSPVDAQAAQAARVPFAAYDNPDLPAQVHINSLAQVADLLGI